MPVYYSAIDGLYYSPTDSRNYQLELEIVESSQDTTNNTTTISYWLFLRTLGSFFFQDFASTIALTIDGVSLLNTTTQRVSLPSANSATLLTSGTRVINHNADGSKTIPFSASFRTNSTTSFTPIPTHIINNSMVLTTIPRASQPTLNVSTQALGSAITINTNRASTTFPHTLRYTFGNQSGTIATGVEDSTSWTLPNSLANAIPNSQSGSGLITCETYSGGVLIGTRTVAFTATVPDNATFQPNASISSIIEGQSGLTVFSVFIQNISRLRVQSTGSGNFGATISQQRVSIDGGHLFGADVTFNPINKNGTLTVTLLVTDSRGYTRTVTQNVTLAAYFNPRINSFSASRSPNDQGTDLAAPVDFEIAPISNQNTRYYRVRYRVVGGSWVLLFESSAYYSRVFTHTATGVLNANNSYEIELFVGDSFGTATQIVTVTTAFDLLNFNQSGKGLAIGKVSEGDIFEVDLPGLFTKPVTFTKSINMILYGVINRHIGNTNTLLFKVTAMQQYVSCSLKLTITGIQHGVSSFAGEVTYLMVKNDTPTEFTVVAGNNINNSINITSFIYVIPIDLFTVGFYYKSANTLSLITLTHYEFKGHDGVVLDVY